MLKKEGKHSRKLTSRKVLLQMKEHEKKRLHCMPNNVSSSGSENRKNAFFMFIVSFDCTTDLHLNDNCYLFIAFK